MTVCEWDAEKAEANIAKHGVPFDDISGFDWGNIVKVVDDRFDYGEERIRALGTIRGRVHAVVYVQRGDVIRLISLRKANAREVRNYERYR